MPESFAYWGFLAFLVGLPAASAPYALSKIDEEIDAIGRKDAGEVEPADWRVVLTRAAGRTLVVLGALLVVADLTIL